MVFTCVNGGLVGCVIFTCVSSGLAGLCGGGPNAGSGGDAISFISYNK